MGQPAAKQNDKITATDSHIVVSVSGATSTVPLPFNGVITSKVSTNVNVQSMPAATIDSVADNTPPHIPPPGTSFKSPPSNKATIITGSATVLINGKGAARNGDSALTCNDPIDLPAGTVVAVGTVRIGG